MDPELTALTSTAATTVVTLLATAAWEQAKTAVGGLWRRVHPERAETDAMPQSTTITMQATTFGHSRAIQAGHDLHVTER